jgi:hypothetical protein
MTYSEFLVDITTPVKGVIRAGPWLDMVSAIYLTILILKVYLLIHGYLHYYDLRYMCLHCTS